MGGLRRFPAPVQPIHRTRAASLVAPSASSGLLTREEISKTWFFRQRATQPGQHEGQLAYLGVYERTRDYAYFYSYQR
jgi:hypothetical protein